jgi:predicted DNA-binding antitoxin AbrB/MazE fold protein
MRRGAHGAIEAVYEGGVLRPVEKLDLEEGQRVWVRVFRNQSVEEFLERNPCFRPDPLADGPTDLSEKADEYLYGPVIGDDD